MIALKKGESIEKTTQTPVPTIGKGQYVRTEPRIGRNEQCNCGSGKKYKKCCGR